MLSIVVRWGMMAVMNTVPRGRIVLLTALCVASMVLFPAWAKAECGDYVVYADSANTLLPHLPQPKSKPCSGPICSGQMPLAPAEPAPAPPTDVPAKLAVLRPTSMTTPEHSWCIADANGSEPFTLLNGIFRPPR